MTAPPDPHATLAALLEGHTLSEAESTALFASILDGNLDNAQIAATLTLIQQRGITLDELVGAARVMRERVTPVPVPQQLKDRLIDTCGTGGAPKTFNISTAAALIAAGTALAHPAPDGTPAFAVAKHGNRSRSGRGSAEVLAQLGINLDATPQTQATCLEQAAVCFSFAVNHHPAMRAAAAPRKSLGFPTPFNLLGPLTNPAGAQRQLLGVYNHRYLPLVAGALARLGAQRALVVHGADGLDEITTTDTTHTALVADQHVTLATITPQQLGLRPATIEDLRVATPEEAANAIRDILDNKPSPKTDAALANAGAAIHIVGLADSIPEGVELARDALATGYPNSALDTLRTITNA